MLDVFEDEPLPAESELWAFENVWVSAHSAYCSEKNEDRRFEIVFRNLKGYVNAKRS